jgi:hypothetical protein
VVLSSVGAIGVQVEDELCGVEGSGGASQLVVQLLGLNVYRETRVYTCLT